MMNLKSDEMIALFAELIRDPQTHISLEQRDNRGEVTLTITWPSSLEQKLSSEKKHEVEVLLRDALFPTKGKLGWDSYMGENC